MALQFKDVPYESIDALALAEHARLRAVNRRAEVPVLVDGDVTVRDSADIVAYLEDRFPTPPLLPSSPARRVTARRWARIADTVLDSIWTSSWRSSIARSARTNSSAARHRWRTWRSFRTSRR